MEIFDWAKEIEKVYEELIEKTKKENLAEIQALRKEQEKNLETAWQKKQNIVNDALKILSERVNDEIELFKSKLTDLINEIRNNFDIVKPELIKLLLEKLNLDFYA